MEIRLCSIAAARWLSQLPDSGPIPRPPKGAGEAFVRALDRRLKESSDTAALKNSPLEGLVLTLKGVVFQSRGLVASMAHALASANLSRGSADQRDAYAIEHFIEGTGEYAWVPEMLTRRGVYSVLPRANAKEFADWLSSVDETRFAREVGDMHGAVTIPVYQAVLRDVRRTFESALQHDSDLCCIEDQAGGLKGNDG